MSNTQVYVYLFNILARLVDCKSEVVEVNVELTDQYWFGPIKNNLGGHLETILKLRVLGLHFKDFSI